jgi:hypothetical protein
MVCLLWRSTSPHPCRQSLPKVTLYPSPTLSMGGLGGAFAPSNRRLRRPSQSLRTVHVQLGGVLNLIPSLKHMHPSGHPYHALAGSCHRLNMGGSLELVAVSPPIPSLPQLGMGGTMVVSVVGPCHLFRLWSAASRHITQTPPPVLRFSMGGGSDSSSLTKGASVASPTPLAVPPPGPIPLPVDRFTLPVIKNATDYLAACVLILYWLRRPGFSTARSDSAPLT